MTNRGTSGTQINTTAWMRSLSESFPCSYAVWKDSSTTPATFRAESNVSGGTDYNGSSATTVIQAAIDALTGGGLIFLKGTNFSLGTTGVTIDKEGIILRGLSTGHTSPLTKITYSGIGSALRVRNTSALYGFGLEDFYVDAGAGAGAVGVELYDCHWGNVKNVFVYNGATGLKMYGAWETVIERCILRSQTAQNLLLEGHAGAGANHITIRNSYFDGAPKGIELSDSTNNPVAVNIQQNNFGFATNMVGIEVNYQARKLNIVSNYFEEAPGQTGTKQIYLQGSGAKIMEGVTISKNAFITNNYAIYADYVDNVDIHDNWAYGYGTPIFLYMTANALDVVHRNTQFAGVAFTNTITSQCIWHDSEYTKALIYVPIVAEAWTVAETGYTYKYYMFKLDTTKYSRIIAANFEASIRSPAAKTIYIKLVKNDGGWVDVTGSELTDNTNGWVTKTSGDIKANLSSGNYQYMIQVMVTGGTGDVNWAALKLTLA